MDGDKTMAYIGEHSNAGCMEMVMDLVTLTLFNL